ncbi:uncharacterized protein LOC143038806 isoform X2 [Oratosquilla oratoria]|uniref:uncharacterized protein LOC143038806 isoform X2 n=1 Tax=Oratosquilla oratoria TaxID=337810 RepID=UPI003F762D92
MTCLASLEYVQIVQRPVFIPRPYAGVASPYHGSHPWCSVLCNHPPARPTHRHLLSLTRVSWLQEVRAHICRAGTVATSPEGAGGRHSPSGLPHLPATTSEGLQVNIPEEFLVRFARSDSRPDSPAPSLFSRSATRHHPSAYRRCLTPDSMEPIVQHDPAGRLKRALSADDLNNVSGGTLMLRAALSRSGASPPRQGANRHDLRKFESDFTQKLSKQLDHMAKGKGKGKGSQQQSGGAGPHQETRGGPGGQQMSPDQQGSENAKKGGAPAATAKKTRKGKRKRDTATLDDPGQTGVSRVGDSRSGSSKGRGGSSSTRSSSSMGRHKNVEGDIQSQAFDPKRLRELQAEMIQVRGENEESEEMIRLKAALDGTGVGGRDSGLGGSTYSAASRGFWLDLPRAPSHRAAVFTLPAQMTRLQGISALEYLHRYVRLRSSRKLLHSTVFTRHRDVEAKGEWMKKSDLETALSEALGGKVESCHMDQLEGLLTLPPEHVSKEQFSSIAALAERLFCNELLPTPTVEVEPRDLVEQLDFSHLENKLEGLVVDEPLKALLTTISSLT